MAKIMKLPDEMKDRFSYVSRIRYHRSDYPYKVALENKGRKLVLYHLAIVNDEWQITHSVALEKTELAKMLETIKR